MQFRTPSAVLVAAIVTSAAAGLAHAQYVPVTTFPKTNNAQAALQAAYPTGAFTSPSGVQYSIVADASNNNFLEVNSTTTIDLTPLNLTNVTALYGLLNAYGPVDGTNLSIVTITGTGGATTTFSLIAGTNVRDFYQGAFANNINGTTSREAFRINGVVGGGGTGNSSTGFVGNYVIDEVLLPLTPAFDGQALTSITFTRNSTGVPILLGLTAVVPEPAALAPLIAAAALMSRRRR